MDAEEAGQLQDVAKMMATPGWGHVLLLLNLEREKNINIVKKAKLTGPSQEHGFEYYQGILLGFDSTVSIFDNLKRRYEETLEAAKEEIKEGSND
jgi:hypothetical protein